MGGKKNFLKKLGDMERSLVLLIKNHQRRSSQEDNFSYHPFQFQRTGRRKKRTYPSAQRLVKEREGERYGKNRSPEQANSVRSKEQMLKGNRPE